MKKLVYGEKIEMTSEEIEAMREAQKAHENMASGMQTTEERLADLEASNAELREALDLILSGGTE